MLTLDQSLGFSFLICKMTTKNQDKIQVPLNLGLPLGRQSNVVVNRMDLAGTAKVGNLAQPLTSCASINTHKVLEYILLASMTYCLKYFTETRNNFTIQKLRRYSPSKSRH